jgi:unsaturated rhamnogalacturonyl hydrolase
MKIKLQSFILCFVLLVQASPAISQDLEWDIGLSTIRTVIKASGVKAATQGAPTILYVAGLNGESDSSSRLRSVLSSYAQINDIDRPVNLIVVPLANPESEPLSFPPSGSAYSENPVANALWRWIGVHAPDLVIIANEDSTSLASALQNESVAGIGSIPVQQLTDANTSMSFLLGSSSLAESAASIEVRRRLDRTPNELAEQLAQSYGYDFSSPVYVPGMSLIGRMRLGYLDEVASLIGGFLADTTFEVSNASLLAGQLVFAEYAERTGDEDSLQLAIRAAELAFDEQGNMRETMPMHSEMSDSVFMATPLLVKVGKLTGDSKYFDMAFRHVAYMQSLLLRDDGLYNHSPLADVAWSRGNAFPVLGLALSLSNFPESHPGYEILKNSFLQHLDALRPYQDIDGMWLEVIDYPGSFAELTTTAMIGIAIKRGLDSGLLQANIYQPILSQIWDAVRIRTSLQGEFINACTSTGKMQSLDAYLDRLAVLGRDDRAGGMVMIFANEMAGNM